MAKSDQELSDIASYTARTHQLTDEDKLKVALELVGLADAGPAPILQLALDIIRMKPGLGVRPEITAYLREAIREGK